MKLLISISMLLTLSFAAQAEFKVTSEKSLRSKAYIDGKPIQVRLAKTMTVSKCDSFSLSGAVNELDYADQSNIETAAEKRVFVIESRIGRSGELGCELSGAHTLTKFSEWKTISFTGRHVNLVEIHHDAGTKLEVRNAQ